MWVLNRRGARGWQRNRFSRADHFFNRDGHFGNLHQFFERNGRATAPAYGFQCEFDFPVMSFIAFGFGAPGLSVVSQLQSAKIADPCNLAVAEYLELLFWNRPVAVGQI